LPLDRISEVQDRSWTFALLDQVRSSSISQAERDETVDALAMLEDFRSVDPLMATLEDDRLPGSVREAAGAVLRAIDDTTTAERRRGWWHSGDRVLMSHALLVMGRSEADILAAVAADDRHPLQAQALAGMLFEFDEAEFQPVKIRALEHPDAEVRESAADVLMWDEPVAAEGPLLVAASDSSTDVATAAVDTLRYYRSRRVLRVLAEMSHTADEQVRDKARESFEDIRGHFEWLFSSGVAAAQTDYRQWVEPVEDLLCWSEVVPEATLRLSAAAAPAPVAASASELLDLLLEPDGEWAPRKELLRHASWRTYGHDERDRLAAALTRHPDPDVREVATVALAAWSRADELLELTHDPSRSVRKSAMYHLGVLPPDPSLAACAWAYLLDAAGTTGSEAVQTYVAHAPTQEAKQRLVELARYDHRESVRTQAISSLVDLDARSELEGLVPLLRETPGVTWAVHIGILDGLCALGLPAPHLDELAAVDNVDVLQSVVALRYAST